jgi:hypothetical protein
MVTYRYAHLESDTGENRIKNDAPCPTCHGKAVEAVEWAGGWWRLLCVRGCKFKAKRYFTHIECRAMNAAEPLR